MDPLWTEFRRGPSAYLSARKTNMETFVHGLLQGLQSNEKGEQWKMAVLGIFQEMPEVIFTEPSRLDVAMSTLKSVFQQLRGTGSSSLVCSQISCTITTLLIQMEPLLSSHDRLLVEFVGLLFDVIEKVKTDSNRLLKSIGCECLKELETAYPGLLSMKVGHFYGMSMAENSYIHQNYMALFATVLEHTVLKLLLEQGEDSPYNGREQTMTDLLSFADPLKAFSLPEDLKEQAAHILREPPECGVGEGAGVNEVKRGVSFLLDHFSLMTPACLKHVALRMVSCVWSSSLNPKMLKSLLLQYSSSKDLQLFHLVLLLRLKFGKDICDEGDEECIKKWLTILSCHPSLPQYRRGLLLQWLMEWPAEELYFETEDGEGEEGEGEREEREEERERGNAWTALLPTVFDSLDLFTYKLRLLSTYWGSSETPESGPPKLSNLLCGVLKLVHYGIGGAPAVLLYRTLFSYYLSPLRTALGEEISSLTLAVMKEQPMFIPNTVDFLTAVEKHCPDSPLPLMLLAEFSQHQLTAELGALLSHLPLHLSFIRQAAAHSQINPLLVLQIIGRVLRGSSLCVQGPWDIGNAVLDVCNTIMRKHHTETIFKDLAELLQLISGQYNDLDIRDRARFYHQLLLTCSGGKLSAILTLASDTTTGSSLSAVVEARISDSVFPSAPPVRKIPEPFLLLTRVEEAVPDAYSNGSKVTEASVDKEEAVKSYLQLLDSYSGLVPVQLQYQITFSKKPEGISQRIYAVVLKLHTDGPYHSSPDVYIPYLAAEEPGVPSTSSSKLVILTFYPKEPVPAHFEVSAVFTVEEGVTCATSLAPISVEFADLFQPLPPHILQKVPSEELFALLWKCIEETQHSASPMGRFGVLSTMYLKFNEEEWETHTVRFHNLQVPPNGNSGGGHRLLAFLPPRFHLLLRFDVELQSALIATDNWRILPLINSYLQILRKRSEREAAA